MCQYVLICVNRSMCQSIDTWCLPQPPVQYHSRLRFSFSFHLPLSLSMTAMFTYVLCSTVQYMQQICIIRIHPQAPKGHPPDFFFWNQRLSNGAPNASCSTSTKASSPFSPITAAFPPCCQKNPRAVCTNSEAVPLRESAVMHQAGARQAAPRRSPWLPHPAPICPWDRGRLQTGHDSLVDVYELSVAQRTQHTDTLLGNSLSLSTMTTARFSS